MIIFDSLDNVVEVLMDNYNGILFNDGLNATINGLLDQKQFILKNINTAKNSNDKLFWQDMIEYVIKPIRKKLEMILTSVTLNNSGKHNGLGVGYDTQTDCEPSMTHASLSFVDAEDGFGQFGRCASKPNHFARDNLEPIEDDGSEHRQTSLITCRSPNHSESESQTATMTAIETVTVSSTQTIIKIILIIVVILIILVIVNIYKSNKSIQDKTAQTQVQCANYTGSQPAFISNPTSKENCNDNDNNSNKYIGSTSNMFGGQLQILVK